MDEHTWQFDEMKACLLNTIETLNGQIREVAQAPASISARNRGDAGIAQWKEEVGRTIAILEAAKKVVLARLGPG
jgi:hypothetical protein